MKSKKLHFIFLSLIISILVFSGCAQNSSSNSGGQNDSGAKEVTVGVSLPLTGSNAKLGDNSRRGIELAAEMINGV